MWQHTNLAQVPRDYVSRLEAQIEELKKELAAARSPALSTFPATSTTSPATQERSTTLPGSSVIANARSSHPQDLAQTAVNDTGEPSSSRQFLGPSSGVTLAKLVMSMIHVNNVPSSVDPEQSLQHADHLVNVYFQYRTIHMPR
jgi:hypothetical protein